MKAASEIWDELYWLPVGGLVKEWSSCILHAYMQMNDGIFSIFDLPPRFIITSHHHAALDTGSCYNMYHNKVYHPASRACLTARFTSVSCPEVGIIKKYPAHCPMPPSQVWVAGVLDPPATDGLHSTSASKYRPSVPAAAPKCNGF